MTKEEAEVLFPHERHFPHTGEMLGAFEEAKAYALSLGMSRPPLLNEAGESPEPDDPDGTILPGKFKYLLDVTLRWRDRAASKSA